VLFELRAATSLLRLGGKAVRERVTRLVARFDAANDCADARIARAVLGGRGSEDGTRDGAARRQRVDPRHATTARTLIGSLTTRTRCTRSTSGTIRRNSGRVPRDNLERLVSDMRVWHAGGCLT
jgi:hypothetical protein